MYRIDIEYKQRGTGEYFAVLYSYKNNEKFELFNFDDWLPISDVYITNDRRKLDKLKKDVKKKLKDVKETILRIERAILYNTTAIVLKEVYTISENGVETKIE
jgi:hypothetical protein